MKMRKIIARSIFIITALMICGCDNKLYSSSNQKNGSESILNMDDTEDINRTEEVKDKSKLVKTHFSCQIMDRYPEGEKITTTINLLKKRMSAQYPYVEIEYSSDNLINIDIWDETEVKDISYYVKIGELYVLDSNNYKEFLASRKWSSTLKNSDIVKAEPYEDEASTSLNKYGVRIELSEQGKDRLKQLTADNIGEPIYIFIDREIINAPTVKSVISEGKFSITDIESMDKAEKIANIITLDTLPFVISVVNK